MTQSYFRRKTGRAVYLSAGITLFFLSTLFFASPTPSQGKAQGIRISIHTRQGGVSNAAALGNVTVQFGPKTLTTDRAGEATIVMPASEYNVKAYLQGFIVSEFSVVPDELGGYHGFGLAKTPEGDLDFHFLYRSPYDDAKDDYSVTIYMKPGDAPQKQERLPIIFLPGVAGTELKDPGTGNQLWPFIVYGSRFKMMLDSDGRGNADRVRIGGILRSGVTNFYGGMLSYLASKGYQENTDLFIFPYDWRLDPDSENHFARLDQLIEEALSKSRAKKVILLAHSLGGVVARSYLILRPASAAKVDCLISMGTPYWGSVKPFYGLVDGYDFDNPQVSSTTMKILARNFPAAHCLLPQLPFIVDTNGRDLSLDESFGVQYKGYIKGPGGIDDYKETDGLVWNINATLLERARKFWAQMGTVKNPTPLPKGVKHYVIIGYGNRTMDGYQLEPATDDDYFAIGSGRFRGTPLWGDGDITVPKVLAEIKTATKTYYVRFKNGAGGSKIGRVSSQHGDLPANPTVQSLVWDIIEGKPNDGSFYSYSKPSSSAEEYVDFTLHSDAHLSITDESDGGRLGFNSQGGIDQTLPTGSFVAIGKGEYASLLNVSKKYTVTVKGIREGKFTLFVTIGKGEDPLAKFTYPEVPVKNGTIAQFTLNPSQALSSPPPLAVTTNGKTMTVPASIIKVGSPFMTLLYVCVAVIGLLFIAGLSFVFIRRRRSRRRRRARVASSQAGINPNVMPEGAIRPVAVTADKRCPNPRCGKVMSAGNRFCSACGSPLNP
jgi:pimeloyl-ACP methyl ester carboxylesterase